MFKSAVPLRIASTDERNGRIRNFKVAENREYPWGREKETASEWPMKIPRRVGRPSVQVGKVQVIICYCFSFQQNTKNRPTTLRINPLNKRSAARKKSRAKKRKMCVFNVWQQFRYNVRKVAKVMGAADFRYTWSDPSTSHPPIHPPTHWSTGPRPSIHPSSTFLSRVRALSHKLEILIACNLKVE